MSLYVLTAGLTIGVADICSWYKQKMIFLEKRQK